MGSVRQKLLSWETLVTLAGVAHALFACFMWQHHCHRPSHLSHFGSAWQSSHEKRRERYGQMKRLRWVRRASLFADGHYVCPGCPAGPFLLKISRPAPGERVNRATAQPTACRTAFGRQVAETRVCACARGWNRGRWRASLVRSNNLVDPADVKTTKSRVM